MATGPSAHVTHKTAIEDRVVSLGPGLPAIPERLLLAHARGQVLFIAGAGVSRAAGLPDFRDLVLAVYKQLDVAVHTVIKDIPPTACSKWTTDLSSLTNQQAAEVRRFIVGDYDVVLGMLERRLDGHAGAASSVRKVVGDRLRVGPPKPARIHRALMRLADRGGSSTIVTTNFEFLLEDATPRKARRVLQSYALGGIPRPGRNQEFAGVLHIHGALDRSPRRASDLIISDHDFGEFYLRRRLVPDFIYDAARLFHIVLVGYSANDPPMRYLLNAVAADGSRFDDLKERFTLIGGDATPDPIQHEDWRGRGITPIHYDRGGGHVALEKILDRWADLSAINGKPRLVEYEISRIVGAARNSASIADRDLFDHLIRRADSHERNRLLALASRKGADHGWLDAAISVIRESGLGAP